MLHLRVSQYDRNTISAPVWFRLVQVRRDDTMQELAFWVSPGRGEIRPVAVAEPGPGQVRVRTCLLYTSDAADE